MRDVWLGLHIIGVAAWLGANFTQLFVVRILESGSHETAKTWHSASALMVRTYYNAAGALITVTGILLVIDGDWEWSSGFIAVGFTTIVIGGALGVLFFAPTSQRAIAAHEAGDDIASHRVLRRFTLGALVDTTLVIVTIFAMVGKWGV
jgi:uncharacterized membrane protein